MSKYTHIIGIDPGLASLGWGVIRIENNRYPLQNTLAKNPMTVTHMGHGVIETSATRSLEQRLLSIEQSIDAIFSRYDISVLAYEQQFFVKNITSGMQVAHALGVILLYAAKLGLQVESFTPREIKLQITGSASARKDTIQTFLCRFLNLDEITVHHASDALGAAISYFYKKHSKL